MPDVRCNRADWLVRLLTLDRQPVHDGEDFLDAVVDHLYDGLHWCRDRGASMGWLRVEGIWHEEKDGTGVAKCGRAIPAGVIVRQKFPSGAVPCPACTKGVAKQQSASRRTASAGGSRPRPKVCDDCGKARAPGINLCQQCAEARGYRKCVSCSRLYLPTRKRQRSCGQCSKSGSSVRAVSGGLPSLGKRAK